MVVALDIDQAIEQRRARLTSELQRFMTIVINQLHPERIILFGSFATGHIGEWSDLDLAIVTRTKLPFYQRLDQIYRAVEPRVGMDVLVYTPEEWADLAATRRFVQEEIVEKGRVLYETAVSTATTVTHAINQLLNALPDSSQPQSSP